MNDLGPLVGDAVEMLPLTGEALAAWADGDRDAVERLTGAVFPDPLVAPPLMDDALPFMRDRLLDSPGEVGLWSWLCVHRATGQAVGSAGFAGPPDQEGFLVLGYAIYPAFAGAGYASQAASLLRAWGLSRPGVAGIRVTAPVDHPASLRVAAKAGFVPAGRAHDADAGEVVVLEAR